MSDQAEEPFLEEEDFAEEPLPEAEEELAEEPIFEAEEEIGEEPIVEEDEVAEEADEDVAEHLKDAVDGSFRLKRMLSQDGGAAKKGRLNESSLSPAAQAKADKLLQKWQLTQELSVRLCLQKFTEEEIQYLVDTNFTPSKFDNRKGPSELTVAKVVEFREKKLPPGAGMDVLSSFKFYSKLTLEQERQLRTLTHKDLRYVIDKYDGTSPLEDVIGEASGQMPDEDLTVNAAPDMPGPMLMGRFNRLELIDPMADCAVFGDANLTFSLILARHRKMLGHVGRVIATTFEEIETLRERYKEIDESIKILEEHDAEVYHGVDCTRIALDSRFKEMEGTLGAVYYNFPHSGAIQGFFDSHPMVNWRHENLMRLFFRALRSFVKPGGVVKVTSSKGAVGVRYGYIVGGATENEFQHVETMPFLEWTLHRYGRSYGDRRDLYKRPDAKNNQSYAAQNANNDMVYCFRYAPTGADIGQQGIRAPPTLQDLNACTDGPFANVTGPARASLAKKMNERFLTEISGTHVG